jgi:flagellar protein FlaG
MLIRQLDGSPPLAVAPAEGVSAPAPGASARTVEPAALFAPLPREEAQRAVESANRSLRAVAPSLEFEIDPDTRVVIVRLVDTADRKVLRQVPAAELLEIARALDRMQTLLLRSRA